MTSANLKDKIMPTCVDGQLEDAGRGQQLGRQLAERICQVASEAGYKAMRLDCLPTLTAAQQLYLSLCFKPIGAYVFNPIEGAQFLERDLSES